MPAKLIYLVAANREEARKIGQTLVEERLAACANLLGDIESFYFWEGKFESGHEVALILKTTEALCEALVRRAKELHSYSCPAIVVLPIEGGYAPYLSWISTEVGGRGTVGGKP